MSGAASMAERGVVAICAHLSLSLIRSESDECWIDSLAEILPRCQGNNKAVQPLIDAAYGLVAAPSGRAKDTALGRVRFEARQYFAQVAAHQVDALLRPARGDDL